MNNAIDEHLAFLSGVICSDVSTAHKIKEMLPLRELLTGQVLENNPLVADFIRQHWSQLSRVLFSLNNKDVDGFKDQLLTAMLKYPPRIQPLSNGLVAEDDVYAEQMLEQA